MSHRLRRIILTLTLICTLVLGLVVFLYPALKPIPSGVDASSYIFGANWIKDHQTIPAPGQPTYHGLRAYTAPLTDLNLVIMQQLSGADITYPLFPLYQLLLIVLLLMSAYLVGRLYNPIVALLYPLALLGSFALIRLYVGSSVANILAFVYLNVLYYVAHAYAEKRQPRLLIAFGLIVLGLFMTHNYLSAPIALGVLILHLALLWLTRPDIRHSWHQQIRRWPWYATTAGGVVVAILGVLAIQRFMPVLLEARNAFWQTTTTDRFMNIVTVREFPLYLGPTLFTLGAIGALIYVFRRRRYFIDAKTFPILWIVVLLLLLQSYHLGVNFFFERLVFLGGTFVAFFAAYAVATVVIQRTINRLTATVLVALVAILLITGGANQVKSLYDASNLVSQTQIDALLLLKQVSTPESIIYSHHNGASQTAHDVLMSHRDIIHWTTAATKCPTDAPGCLAFTRPSRQLSQAFFETQHVDYFLFLKPSTEGNELLERLQTAYVATQRFQTLYAAQDVLLLKRK